MASKSSAIFCNAKGSVVAVAVKLVVSCRLCLTGGSLCGLLDALFLDLPVGEMGVILIFGGADLR